MQVHKTITVNICIAVAAVPWFTSVLFCSLIYVDILILFLTIFICYKRNAQQLILCLFVTHAPAHCSITKVYYNVITSVLFCKLINVYILLLFLTICICYKAELDTLLMLYTHAPFQVHLSIINFMDIYSISYQVIGGWVVGAVDLKSGGLEMLVVQILPWTRLFCNVHLFRVHRSWIGSVQMKSSMTFIRGYRCIERER